MHCFAGRQAFIWVMLAMCFLPVACNQGKRTVTVTGSVLKAGQAIPLSPTGAVEVTLLPDVGDDMAYTTRVARCEKDGSFKIPDVVPGKYKIGVQQNDPNPQSDKLNGAFRAGDSKIVVNIDGKAPLSIDLAKPKLGQ